MQISTSGGAVIKHHPFGVSVFSFPAGWSNTLDSTASTAMGEPRPRLFATRTALDCGSAVLVELGCVAVAVTHTAVSDDKYVRRLRIYKITL